MLNHKSASAKASRTLSGLKDLYFLCIFQIYLKYILPMFPTNQTDWWPDGFQVSAKQ